MLLKALLSWMFPSKAAKEEVERLKRDTEEKIEKCREDAMKGDVEAASCLNRLEETISVQSMRISRGGVK